jgi:pyrimidine-nucleoside phosphorylase
MVETVEEMGKKVVALITNMDQPLGSNVGNALEVAEAIDVLHGGGPGDLLELCLELAGWMFYLGGAEQSPALGKRRAGEMIRSGAALEKFRQMVELQGGDARVVDDLNLLPKSRHTTDVVSAADGFVTRVDCQAVGVASVVLGGGRSKKEDSVDPAVGIVMWCKPGDETRAGEPLCTIHYNSETQAAEAAELLQKSFQISGAPPAQERPLVRRKILGSSAPEIERVEHAQGGC